MAERKTDAPIGVFDSGLGGLTVTKELVKTLPGENLVYFGDTARVPYGSKSKETILHYTKQILNFMKTQEVKAIVVACNTVSAYALEEVRNRVKVPMIGVVRPGAETAAFVTKNRKIGVIGTKATVESRLYETCIREMIPEAEVYGAPCPLFVPLVEEG
ncbi:MAG: glutamate racemase, partial [Lachnospiraceae bacterium]|nr:glutamate racemase [Lachnospiraceae bacterium]